MSKHVHEVARQIRISKGWSQNDVAERMGVTRSVVAQFESGRTNPTKRTIARIASALGVTTDVLEGKAVKSTEIADLKVREQKDVVLVPIVGEVRAGFSMYAQNNIIGYQKVDSDQINQNKTYFYLKVIGDSMDKYINEGDIVLVEHTPEVETGDIVIALVNEDEAVIKRVKFLNNSLALIPESKNSTYKTQIYEPSSVMIVGKVIKAERFF